MALKVIIIGGGVSGLSAGIYAQKCGFQSEIHEKHVILGGQCTGWTRQGYKIDNCVHWLTGTNPDTDIYKVWCDVGALGPDIKVFQNRSFIQMEHEGQILNIWQDTARLKADMLAISPEDKDIIEEFINGIEIYKAVPVLTTPAEMRSPLYMLKTIMKLKDVGKVHKVYSKMTLDEFAAKFRHPLLRKVVNTYMPKNYNVSSMFYVYATFSKGNGALPEGGSVGIVKRMQERYESLGGKVFTNHEACHIDIEGKNVKSVTFKDGSTVTGDYVICSCDTYEAFYRLIGPHLMDDYFRDRYERNKDLRYSIYTSVNCYFGVDCKAGEILPETLDLECNPPIDVLGHPSYDALVKHFDYEPSFAPEGKSVLQSICTQYDEDYDHWKALYDSDRDAYKEAKLRIGDEIRQRLEARFPELAGKITLLDVATPVTHHRYCNAYKGAYMSFVLSPLVPKKDHPGRIKGVDNLILAGQWLQSPGGMPVAVVTGRYAAMRLCKTAHVKFRD